MIGSNVDLNIVARFNDQISAPLQRTQTRMQTFTKSVKTNWLAVTAGVTATILAVHQLQRTMGAMVSAATRQEDAIKRLNIALEIQGSYTDELSRKYQEMAKIIQKETRFGNEAVEEAMQTLIAVGGVTEKQMDRATQATINFAAATGRDLNTAALTVAKAAAGFTGELSRYGIIIDANIPQSEKFAAALGFIEKRFGGAAQKDVNSYAGQVAQLQNAWSDLLEDLGMVIIMNKLTSNTIQDLKTEVEALSKVITTVSEAIDKLEKTAVGRAFLSALQVTFNSYQIQMVALANAINKTTDETKKFKDEAGDLGDEVTSVLDDLRQKVKEGLEESTKEYGSFAENMKSVTQDVVADMETTFGNFFYDTLTGQMKDAEDLFRSFGDYVLRMFTQIAAQTVMYGTSGSGGLMGLLSGGQGGANIGASLVSGLGSLMSGGWGGLAAGAMKLFGFQTGTEYVPRTGMYQLHRGEKIVPAHNAKDNEAGATNVFVNFSLMSAADVHRHSKAITDVVSAAVAKNANIRGIIKRSL